MDDSKFKTGPKLTRAWNRILKIPLLLLIVTKITCGFDDEITLMNRDGIDKFDISIHIEDRVEFLHSRVTLRPLKLGLHGLEKMMNDFDKEGLSSLGHILKAKLKNSINRITKNAERFVGNANLATREKRSIEFIGNLISKAFGNPGPEDWRKNNANIIAMKNAMSRIRDNSIILHNNIDSNLHHIEHHNELLKKLATELSKDENRLQQTEISLIELENFFKIESMCDAISEILDSLHEIRRDSKIGRCNIKGFSNDFLISNLRKIESNRQGIAPIFASWEWESYYRFEMCTTALNRDEIWTTLRVPIIKPSEKMTRIIPNSNFLWIRNRMDAYGIDIYFFREISYDIYSVLTLANFEMCSILGTSRVCSARKTKFKEDFNFLVPIEISNTRFILISNSTQSKKSEIETECRSLKHRFPSGNSTFLKIPLNCQIKEKSFEISEKVGLELSNEFATIDTIDQFEYKELSRINVTNWNIEIKNISRKDDSAKFDENINKTTKALNQIVEGHEGIFDEIKLIKIGGFTTSSTICFSFLAIAIFCLRKKCKNSGDQKDVNVSINVNPDTKNDDYDELEAGRNEQLMNEMRNEIRDAELPNSQIESTSN
jgi:hypothetical protein